MASKKTPHAILVYGNGHRVRIINAMLINKEPGLQVDDPDPLFLSDRFKKMNELLPMLAAGVFKIESGQPCPKKCKCSA